MPGIPPCESGAPYPFPFVGLETHLKVRGMRPGQIQEVIVQNTFFLVKNSWAIKQARPLNGSTNNER